MARTRSALRISQVPDLGALREGVSLSMRSHPYFAFLFKGIKASLLPVGITFLCSGDLCFYSLRMKSLVLFITIFSAFVHISLAASVPSNHGPVTVSLTARQSSARASLRKFRKRAVSSEPLGDYFNGTDLQVGCIEAWEDSANESDSGLAKYKLEHLLKTCMGCPCLCASSYSDNATAHPNSTQALQTCCFPVQRAHRIQDVQVRPVLLYVAPNSYLTYSQRINSSTQAYHRPFVPLISRFASTSPLVVASRLQITRLPLASLLTTPWLLLAWPCQTKS